MSENSTTPAPSEPAERQGFVQRLVRMTPSDILRLVFLSVLVGFLLAAFRIDPRELWIDFFGTIGRVWERFILFVTHSAADLVSYFLLGAVIVVPIAIVFRLLRASRAD